MNIKHQYLIAFGAAAVVGFFLANAATGTGIYATPVGAIAANIYSAGNSAGGNNAPSTTTATA
jgi:hypothetical protein